METKNLKSQRSGGAVSRRPVYTQPWFEVAAGLLPFTLIGLGYGIIMIPAPAFGPVTIIGIVLFLAGILSLLVGTFVGWLVGFPRWVFPYLVLAGAVSAFLVNASTPGLVIFGVQFFGRDLWGWRAWVPVSAVALLALALTFPQWGNLIRLFQGIWRDWPRLVFGLYGLTVLIPIFILDEIDPAYRFGPTLGLAVFSIVGAWGYFRARNPWYQAAVLLGFAMLIMMGASLVSDIYWQTHTISTSGAKIILSHPVDYGAAWLNALEGAAGVFALMAAPLLVGLARYLADALSGPDSGKPSTG
jgi:hypothetical protein